MAKQDNKTATPRRARRRRAPKAEAGQAEVQKTVDATEDQGFLGEEVDPTPNEEYSLEKPTFTTPETDPKAAAAVGSSRFAGSAGGEG